MNNETVHVRVDDATLKAGDPWEIIHPVWWTVKIYDGPEEYERSLTKLSRPQRLMFALFWYRAEVNNGGHHQFYSNSTGIVWKDALDALRVLELPEMAEVLEKSTQRFGDAPSLDRKKRNQQLHELALQFNDLDERYYAAESKADLDARVLAYMRAHAADFYFDGTIRRTVLPGRKN